MFSFVHATIYSCVFYIQSSLDINSLNYSQFMLFRSKYEPTWQFSFIRFWYLVRKKNELDVQKIRSVRVRSLLCDMPEKLSWFDLTSNTTTIFAKKTPRTIKMPKGSKINYDLEFTTFSKNYNFPKLFWLKYSIPKKYPYKQKYISTHKMMLYLICVLFILEIHRTKCRNNSFFNNYCWFNYVHR